MLIGEEVELVLCKRIECADTMIDNRESPKDELMIFINVDLGIPVEYGNKPTNEWRKSMEEFTECFRHRVSELFKNDDKFYVDFEHSVDKTSKNGNAHGDLWCIIVYPKNQYGYYMDEWIIDLSVGEKKKRN